MILSAPLRAIAIVTACGLSLAACSRTPAPTPSSIDAAASRSAADLDTLVEEYYQEYLQLNPLDATSQGDHRYDDRMANTLSESWLADSLALEQRYLTAVRALDPEALTPAQRLTREVFVYGREAAIDATKYPAELLPLHQMGGLPTFFAQMGSGTSIHPFATVEDYQNFLERIEDFVVWCDQAIANMRVGIEKGVVQPRVIVEKTIPQVAAHAVEDPDESLFYRPVATFPDAIAEDDRARLETAYRTAIVERVVPAYAKLQQFLEQEYLPAARETVGLSDLPGGGAWYASRVRRFTTTDLTPDQIHSIGLTEVERIRTEMDAIREQVGFKGDLPAFIEHLKTSPEFKFESPESLLEAYRALRARVDAEIPRLFARTPRGDFEIRPIEPFRERAAAPASYLPGSPDGTRSAVFYVNTYDVAARPSYMIEGIYLHEAVPGHHFQIALQQERVALPTFRRYLSETAYTEGWGLYAESLGAELGQYQDPYARFGALTAEIWRAVRLVVDTGLHAKGWSRQQALDYMSAHTAIGATDVVAEVDRYIAVPGQALAYKIGQLKLSELRRRAEQELGAGFDIRAFHDVVLEDGSLPLAVLDGKVGRWIAAGTDAPFAPERDAGPGL